MIMDLRAEVGEFAWELARIARAETLPRWLEACAVDNKGGAVFDPVTDADREAERAMREHIRKNYPDHAVTGEEWPDQPGSSPFCWSLDPVDGTRSFICGLPTWTTLIALLEHGRPLLGLIDAPCVDETYVGVEGMAYLQRKGNRTPISTSSCRQIYDARLSTTDPFLFAPAAGDAFDRLRRAARTVRYGHDGYAYARLAAGSLDLIVESGLKPHDYHALIPLITAAGGAIGDWQGGRNLAAGNVIAASTPQLFEEALGYFSALE
jgi:myo-inositol-1(or 4)-monophosphatase